jgi:hypothetical protein
MRLRSDVVLVPGSCSATAGGAAVAFAAGDANRLAVAPQAKLGSHTVEKVNHAPAQRWRHTASSIIEEASENP